MRSAFVAVAALAAVAVAGPAHAQHCAIDVPEHAHAAPRAPRPWWASITTGVVVGAGHVRDAASGFADTTRGYQGAHVEVAAGWRRLGARLALGTYRVDGRGVGVDDLRGAASLELTPARAAVRAGVSAGLTAPTGSADDGRGMGHAMAAGGAWGRLRSGRLGLDASVTYARALGDGAEHAAHLHGSDLWPLVDPMNAVEVLTDLEAGLDVVPRRLALRGGALGAWPVERGARRVVASAGFHLARGALGLTATVSRPVLGDPFVARGRVDVGYRF